MADDPWIGTVLAERFRIESPYYRTQSAEMYRGIDLSSQQEVVIHLAQEQFCQNRDFINRFEQESRRLQALEHPAIIPTLASGRERDRLFMVSPFLPGGSLTDKLRGEWSMEQTNEVIERIGDALAYLHRQEMIHLNVSADSIIFDAEARPHLSMGFGRIWRAVDFSAVNDVYVSPKRTRMKSSITSPKTDIYAFGIVLWTMLTGELPKRDIPIEGQFNQIWDDSQKEGTLGSVVGRAISSLFSSIQEFLAAWQEARRNKPPGLLNFDSPYQHWNQGRDAAAQYLYGDTEQKPGAAQDNSPVQSSKEESVATDNPNNDAYYLDEMGLSLIESGDLAAALPYYERALTIRVKQFGPDHPETAISLNKLGMLSRDMGDYEAARSYLERALAIREKTLAPYHPDTIQSLENLGLVFCDMEDYAAARPYYERALANREKRFGPDHPETATGLNLFGILLHDLKDYAAARSYYERALAIREERLGPDDPDTAATLSNLGLLLQDMGDFAAARSYYERALAIRQTKLGPDHSDTQHSRLLLENLERDAAATPPTSKAPDYTQIDQMLVQEVDDKVARGNVDAAADVASYIESPQIQQTAYQQIEQRARPQTKATSQTPSNLPNEASPPQVEPKLAQLPAQVVLNLSLSTPLKDTIAWRGETIYLSITIQNNGTETWLPTEEKITWHIVCDFLDGQSYVAVTQEKQLKEPLRPQEEQIFTFKFITPDAPDLYHLEAHLRRTEVETGQSEKIVSTYLEELTVLDFDELSLEALLKPPDLLTVSAERMRLRMIGNELEKATIAPDRREKVVQNPLLATWLESSSVREQVTATKTLQRLGDLPVTSGTVNDLVEQYLRENAAATTIAQRLLIARDASQTMKSWLQARLDASQPSEVNSEQSPVSNLQSPHNGQPPAASGQPPTANRQPPAALIPPPPPAFFSSFHLSLDQVVQTERPPQTMTLRVTPQNVLLTFAGKNYESRSKLGEINLKSFVLNRLKYGKALFDAVCHDKDLTDKADNATLKGFTLAMAGLTEGLYIQLYLDDTLHGICWENLCDVDGNPLSISQKTPLYRRVRDNVEKRRVDYGKLRILVMICNPDELGKPIGHEALESLKPVDVANERKILESALQRLEKAGLAEYIIYDGAPGREATLENLREALKPQDGTAYHILHIVAHGIQTNKGFQLVMARQDAKFPLVDADTFKADLHDSELRLAILTSCFSATADEDEEADSPASGRTLPGLAQQLVSEAEIPAVIAMQGLLKADTAALFHHHFYDELARCGRVARAMAVTRRELYNIEKSKPKAGWGVPALFMGTDDDWLFGMDKQKVKQLEPLPSLSSETQKRLREGDWEGLQQQLAAHLPEGLASLAAATPLFAPAAPTRPLTTPQNVRYMQDALRPRTQLNAANLAAYVQQETGLVLDPIVYRQVASALNTGKHILLTGPPGTGKTSLAQAICTYAQTLHHTDDPILTTATADWTTFDTIGGYVPDTQGQLQFRAGIFLRAIRDASWLVIDEMNRAEIDKAFGELFTVLSGQPIELPYNVDGKPVRVLPAAKGPDWLPKQDDEAFNIVIYPAWRIIGTMNVYDKSFLFNMSFAFMRRFAFIDVDLPPRATYHNLLHRWLLPAELVDGNAAAPFVALAWLLQQLVTEDTILMRRRALGPAILKDMIAYVRDRYEGERDAAALLDIFGEAFIMYALPQLDGLDHDSILAIYAHLDQLTAQLSSMMRFTLLRRLKMLYPHISTAEWEQAVLKAAQTS